MDIGTVKHLLHYNPDTGVMTWRIAVARRVKIGDVAGWTRKGKEGKTYRYVEIQGVSYTLHRVIWFYMTGEWPEEVDHADGDGLNNKWLNLSNVSHGTNMRNARLRHDNKSGVPGVIWHKRDIKWETYINYKKERVYLGKHEDFFEAVCARKSAENQHGFHANHGSVRPL